MDPDFIKALDMFWVRNTKFVEKINCKIRRFRKYMYKHTILKLKNLKQAHTNRIFDILSDSRCSGELLCQNFWNQKNVKWSNVRKTNKPRTAKVGAISKAQNLKGGPFGLCETPAGCKSLKKLKGGPFGDMKNFPKKIF